MIKIKIKWYLAGSFFLVTCILLLAAYITLFGILEQKLTQLTAERLRTVLVLGAKTLAQEPLKSLAAGIDPLNLPGPAQQLEKEATPAYRTISDQLNLIRGTYKDLVLYAYFLVPGKDSRHAVFAADADVLALRREAAEGRKFKQISGYGREYDLTSLPQVERAMKQRITVVDPVFIEDTEYNTRSMMGLTPVFDAETQAFLGLLGADISDRQFQWYRNSFFSISMVLIGLVLVVNLAGSWLITRMIGGPMAYFNQAVRNLSQKDFTARIDQKSRIREIHDLTKTFNQMSSGMEDFLQRIQKSVSASRRFLSHEFLKFLGHDDPIDVKLGEQIQASGCILVSDIRNFSSLSEQLTPKQTFIFLNDYWQRMLPCIWSNGGLPESLVGDGIVAFFPGGLPQALEAVKTMRRALAQINQERQAKRLGSIEIGTAMGEGKVLVGIIGETDRLHTVVVGELVNRVKDLESVNRLWKTRNLILAKTEPQDIGPTRLIGPWQENGQVVSDLLVWEWLAPEPPETVRTIQEGSTAWTAASQAFAAGQIGLADLTAKVPDPLQDPVPDLWCKWFDQASRGCK